MHATRKNDNYGSCDFNFWSRYFVTPSKKRAKSNKECKNGLTVFVAHIHPSLTINVSNHQLLFRLIRRTDFHYHAANASDAGPCPCAPEIMHVDATRIYCWHSSRA